MYDPDRAFTQLVHALVHHDRTAAIAAAGGLIEALALGSWIPDPREPLYTTLHTPN